MKNLPNFKKIDILIPILYLSLLIPCTIFMNRALEVANELSPITEQLRINKNIDAVKITGSDISLTISKEQYIGDDKNWAFTWRTSPDVIPALSIENDTLYIKEIGGEQKHLRLRLQDSVKVINQANAVIKYETLDKRE